MIFPLMIMYNNNSFFHLSFKDIGDAPTLFLLIRLCYSGQVEHADRSRSLTLWEGILPLAW